MTDVIRQRIRLIAGRRSAQGDEGQDKLIVDEIQKHVFVMFGIEDAPLYKP